jgi:transcriptional regulator
VIFQGAEHYISPRWYPSKKEHGRVVPTWNYAVVHVCGTVTWFEDIEWLRRHLSELTDTHESGAAEAWHLDDAPGDYLARMMSGILGLEVRIGAVTGNWKVSQNRSRADQQGGRGGAGQSRNRRGIPHARADRTCAGRGRRLTRCASAAWNDRAR